jgi:nucleoside-diphosphate-sugar epimerase
VSAHVAVVAGAGGSLGHATAATLAASGLTVVAADRNEHALRDLPGGVLPEVADTTDPAGYMGAPATALSYPLVRDEARADIVAARGAKATVVDLYDRPAVASLLSKVDGAIHTASPGDATTADLDSAVADAVIDAFAGTGKPYIEISGLWVYGANTSITEESPFHAPALVAWKEPIERRVFGARGMRAVVIVSSTVYGDGAGAIPGALLGSPRDDAGNLIMIGTGQQHWSTVHVVDLADAFRRVLDDDSARGRYVIGNGVNSTVAELTEAAAVAVGAPGAVPVPSRRLGPAWATISPRPCCSIRAPTRPRRARLVSVSSVACRRVPPWQLPQVMGGWPRLTAPLTDK